MGIQGSQERGDIVQGETLTIVLVLAHLDFVNTRLLELLNHHARTAVVLGIGACMSTHTIRVLTTGLAGLHPSGGWRFSSSNAAGSCKTETLQADAGVCLWAV